MRVARSERPHSRRRTCCRSSGAGRPSIEKVHSLACARFMATACSHWARGGSHSASPGRSGTRYSLISMVATPDPFLVKGAAPLKQHVAEAAQTDLFPGRKRFSVLDPDELAPVAGPVPNAREDRG